MISKNPDCVRVLLQAGASPDLQDKEGKTPLHVAVQMSNTTLISILIAGGASVDVLDQDGDSPLDPADEDLSCFINACVEARNSNNNLAKIYVASMQ